MVILQVDYIFLSELKQFSAREEEHGFKYFINLLNFLNQVTKLTSQVMISGKVIKQILPTNKLRGKAAFLFFSIPPSLVLKMQI